MAASYFRLLALCLIAGYAWAERDDKVCSIRTQSCGLIPPPLPRNFEYKAEVADFSTLSLMFQEVYFDNINLKGELVRINENMESHYIFDYQNEQIIEYIKMNPGKSLKRDPLSEVCIAVDMESSDLRFVFGYRDSHYDSKNARMYNSYQAMRYGDDYQYASVRPPTNLENRGLRTNQFTACVYDEGWDATLLTNYFFTDNTTIPPAPDNPFGDSVTVPVKITMNGTIGLQNKKKAAYNVQQSISWFQKNPKFGDDVFKIPQWLYCKNYKGGRDIPEMPTAFSVDLEVTSFTQNMYGKKLTDEILLFYRLYYNVEKGLARRDFTPLRERDTDVYSKFQNLGPVTAIYDFNSGVVYTVNKMSGRCYYGPIQRDEFFVTTKDKIHVRMAGPEEVFFMNRDTAEYKGKDYNRGILGDVWAGKYFDEDMNMTSYLETSISTEGWHDASSNFAIPIRHTVITGRTDDDGLLQQTVVENNFFRFRSKAPPMWVFNLHNTACMDTIDRKYLGMTLSITDVALAVIKKYRWIFLESIQYYMADITEVGTALRIQALRIERIADKDMVTFAILERTKVKANVPATVLGVDLETAIANLQTYVDSGRFLVKFTNPDTDQDMAVLAEPNGLVLFKSPIETIDTQEAETQFFTESDNMKNGRREYTESDNMKNKRPDNIELEDMKNERLDSLYFDDDKTKSPKTRVIKGMSKGGLAGLSIGMLIIGIGVGIAIMYLYIRKFSSSGLEDSYAMQTKR